MTFEEFVGKIQVEMRKQLVEDGVDTSELTVSVYPDTIALARVVYDELIAKEE